MLKQKLAHRCGVQRTGGGPREGGAAQDAACRWAGAISASAVRDDLIRTNRLPGDLESIGRELEVLATALFPAKVVLVEVGAGLHHVHELWLHIRLITEGQTGWSAEEESEAQKLGAPIAGTPG